MRGESNFVVLVEITLKESELGLSRVQAIMKKAEATLVHDIGDG